MMLKLRLLLFCISILLFDALVLSFPGMRTFPQSQVEPVFQLLYLLLLPLNIICFIFVNRYNQSLSLKSLILLLVGSRIVFMIMRLFLGNFILDWDVERFNLLGSELINGHYPFAEYPPFAVLYFAIISFLSWDRVEIFRYIFTFAGLLFEISGIYFIYKIAVELKNEATGIILILAYLFNPFISIFWFSKFDIAPVCFWVLSMYYLIKNRISISSLLLSIGFLLKLFPIASLPFVAIYLYRSKGMNTALRYLSVFISVAIIAGIATRFLNQGAIAYLINFHNSRFFMAESIYYLPSFILEPSLRITSNGLPWGEIPLSIFGNNKILFFQLLIVAAMSLVYFYKRNKEIRSCLLLSGLALGYLVLFNKIFSPQFYLFIYFAFLVILVSTRISFRKIVIINSILFFVSAANFYIWPAFFESWFVFSILFFILNLLLLSYFLVNTLRLQSVRQE